MNSHILERARAALGLSRADAADALGISREAVRRIEHGTMRPSPDLAWCIIQLARDADIPASLTDIYPPPPAEGAA